MVNTPTVTLKPTGQKMPLVGFGLWKLNNDTCADQVYDAIKAGYRLLDGACGTFFKLSREIERGVADHGWHRLWQRENVR